MTIPPSSGIGRPESEADDPEAARVRAKVLATLVGDEDLASTPQVGRFVLLRRLGQGGMGVVWLAYDPDLDRRVALKLLHRDRDHEGVRMRLIREAQAMAKLSHPNVAAVYEVGTQAGQVYLAMEFVEGRTLRQWLQAETRTWQQVLSAYTDAARGLAAAHALGIVHRDFKPDNALVGLDERVRVVDFGLARREEGSASRPGLESTPDEAGDVRDTPDAWAEGLTHSGALIGTPGYMAPEQIVGAPTDARTDQFACCVALWEALFGTRPFTGETRMELVASVMTGRLEAPPGRHAVPQTIVGVLRRGLSSRPEDRYESMSALIAALERGRWKARLRRGLVLAALVPVAVGAAIGWNHRQIQARVAACEVDGASIEEVWNPSVADGLRSALVGTHVAHAEETAHKLTPWLDAYAEEWRAARTQTCAAARVHDELDEVAFDRATWCLDQRRTQLTALLGDISRGEKFVVHSAVQAAILLADIAPCLDDDVLARTPAPPPEQRDEVGAIRTEISRAGLMRIAGELASGLEIARAALVRAEALAWPPLAAEAHLEIGLLLMESLRWSDAEGELEHAYFAAAQAGALEVAARAAESLVIDVGYRLARPSEGRRWLRHAELVSAGLPDRARLREAERAMALGYLHFDAGDYDEAKATCEQALNIREVALGPDHLSVARSVGTVALVESRRGRYDEAIALHERALAIKEQVLGDHHPDVANTLDNLALVHWELGAYEESKKLYERGLAIREAALGPESELAAVSLDNLAMWHWKRGKLDEAQALAGRALAIHEKVMGPSHARVAVSLSHLAVVHSQRGQHEEARRLLERALTIQEASLGPTHPDLVGVLTNLAIARRALGHRQQALELYERALAIAERKLGPDHPRLVPTLVNLANLYYGLGDPAKAKALYERSLAIDEIARGRDHPDLSHPLLGLANVAIDEERAADAIALAERALALRGAADAKDHEKAHAWFVLARALWLSDEKARPRAREIAERARGACEKAGPAGAALLAQLDDWLAKHPQPPS